MLKISYVTSWKFWPHDGVCMLNFSLGFLNLMMIWQNRNKLGFGTPLKSILLERNSNKNWAFLQWIFFIYHKNEIYCLVIIDEVALVSKFYGINVCLFYLLQGYHFDSIKNAILHFKKKNELNWICDTSVKNLLHTNDAHVVAPFTSIYY